MFFLGILSHLKLSPMTLTIKADIDSVKVNQYVQYLSQNSFLFNMVIETDD